MEKYRIKQLTDEGNWFDLNQSVVYSINLKDGLIKTRKNNWILRIPAGEAFRYKEVSFSDALAWFRACGHSLKWIYKQMDDSSREL